MMEKYKQIKELGEGSYGKAILVQSRVDEKLYVIKEIRLYGVTEQERQDALKEVTVLKSLDNPYIVKYIESFHERGNLYIVMEYADGGDLSQKIQNQHGKHLTEHEILHDFIQLSLAIKHIHDQKILHRDLKCQNVFLTKSGDVKLGDFGISKVLDSTLQMCKTQIGTPYYLSPEICQGQQYNSKTDIWSLGCILYELCTLRHAFNAQNMNALLMNIICGKYAPIPSIYSSDLKQLVSDCLTKDPKARPSINQILTRPIIKKWIADKISGTPITPHKERPTSQNQHRAEKKPFVLPDPVKKYHVPEPKKISPAPTPTYVEPEPAIDLKRDYWYNRKEHELNRKQFHDELYNSPNPFLPQEEPTPPRHQSPQKSREKLLTDDAAERRRIWEMNHGEAKANKMRIMSQLKDLKQLEDSPRRINPDKEKQKNDMMKEALDLKPNSTDDDSFSEPKQPSLIKRKDTVTEIPSFQGNESLFYRAEAIRAFLEREIGIDGLIDLKELILEENEGPYINNPIPAKYDPQIIVLTRQLLILDDILAKAQ